MQNKNDEEQEDIETFDFSKPDYSFVPSGTHDWVQRGPYLICTSCELEHGVYIGVDKWYMGTDDDGKPILENVKLSG